MGLFDAFRMSCRDATYLHGKLKEGKLSFTEAIGLRIHLLYCGLCRLFFKQIDRLEEQAQQLGKSESVSRPLDNSAKEKMQQTLTREMRK